MPLRTLEQNLIALLSLPELLAFNAYNSKMSQKKNGGAITISLIRVDHKTAFSPNLACYKGQICIT